LIIYLAGSTVAPLSTVCIRGAVLGKIESPFGKFAKLYHEFNAGRVGSGFTSPPMVDQTWPSWGKMKLRGERDRTELAAGRGLRADIPWSAMFSAIVNLLFKAQFPPNETHAYFLMQLTRATQRRYAADAAYAKRKDRRGVCSCVA